MSDHPHPALGRLHADVLAHQTELECLSELLQGLALEAPRFDSIPSVASADQTFVGLLRALVEAAPEPSDGPAEALFGLHQIGDADLRRAAITAYAELPAGEATFARRQWRALLRVITAVHQRLPSLRGEVYAYAATRAFAEYRVARGNLRDLEVTSGEAVALVLRHTHAHFRRSQPGLGEAAYTLAPLALLEHLRGMFPTPEPEGPRGGRRSGVSAEIH